MKLRFVTQITHLSVNNASASSNFLVIRLSNIHGTVWSTCNLTCLINDQIIINGLEVVFPRDGTSCGTSRDKPGWDVPLSLCPGTKKNSCPGVPLSRDKARSKNSGKNSSVTGQNEFKNFKKKTRFPV